jgi:hypothetical protein
MEISHNHPLNLFARKYTKPLPPLEIPGGISSFTNSPTATTYSSASTQGSLRAEKRSVWQKMNDVLRTSSGKLNLRQVRAVSQIMLKTAVLKCDELGYRQKIPPNFAQL